MNPIVFALRRPVTVLVLMVALLGGGVFSFTKTKVDVFPSLYLPVIYVAQPYGGMDPAQMEGLIANYYEYHFLYIGGIQHVESKSVQGLALMKLYFHPGTDMAQALAETIAYVNRSRAFMPPGTVPPFVMRFDTGNVAVGYLVLSSDTKSIGEIQDQALFKVRPMFSTIPGVSAPPPFGGNARAVVVRVDPDRLRAYNLSPEDVIKALTAGNAVSPSGNVRIGDEMPIVPFNAMVAQPKELGNIPIRPGQSIYLRHVVTSIDDATDIPTGYALVNGRRAVYIVVTKRPEASTLDVVNAVRANLANMRAALPPGSDINISFEFDQSPHVTQAMRGVALEALLGAALTGLMVLLFLRDWRSAIVVVLNIPLALLGSMIALALTGQTINLMTLGGLALSVGILVDEATVEVENIHTQLEKTGSVAVAVRRGNAETAVPRLLAMLCVLAVFIPSFLMQGAARALFVPLSLAVGFAMITSYLLSSSFVPVLSVWLLRGNAEKAAPSHAGPGALALAYARVLGAVTALRWVVVPAYFLLAAVLVAATYLLVGVEIFPKTDLGQFQLRLRAPPGTRIEETEEIVKEALKVCSEEVGADNIAISLGYVGAIPSSYPINTIYLWSSGPEEAVMRVALKPGGGRRVEQLKPVLREKIYAHLKQWLAERWRAKQLPEEQIAKRLGELRLSFEPADIISDVMSFGSPTPVEVAVSGSNLDNTKAYARKVREQLGGLDYLKDLQYGQSLEYPTVAVTVDREKAGMNDVSAEDVARSLLAATSSSRFVVPNYWADPKTGIGYQVQVEIPQAKMDSVEAVRTIPVKRRGEGALLLRDVADVKEGTMPGEYDRYDTRRTVSLTANVEGEDLGRALAGVRRAVAAAGAPPEGVKVDVRGQATPLRDIFWGLGVGLGLAVVAILLMLTAYYQSPRLALVAVASVPAVLVGVGLMLLVTRTTLNLQSFMGAITAVGVAVANAILLVTFAERARGEGMSAVDAAVAGARSRVRPILMTSAAMIAGMVPMALALGEGGEQSAPLGRAVIGGLAAATLTTLFILPAVFALVMGWWRVRSVSLDPNDPGSAHYHPTDTTPEGPHDVPTR